MAFKKSEVVLNDDKVFKGFQGGPSRWQMAWSYFYHPKAYKAMAIGVGLGLIGTGIALIVLNPFTFSLIAGIGAIVLGVMIVTAVSSKSAHNSWKDRQEKLQSQVVKPDKF